MADKQLKTNEMSQSFDLRTRGHAPSCNVSSDNNIIKEEDGKTLLYLKHAPHVGWNEIYFCFICGGKLN